MNNELKHYIYILYIHTILLYQILFVYLYMFSFYIDTTYRKMFHLCRCSTGWNHMGSVLSFQTQVAVIAPTPPCHKAVGCLGATRVDGW